MVCRWEETHDCQFCVLDCPGRHTSINIEALEQMASVPTPRQRDEIDEWLEKECHIYAGACSSVENLKYSTAREVAEKLWKKEEPVSEELEEATTSYADNHYMDFAEQGDEDYWKTYYAFKAGAKWQKQQNQSTIELAEDHAMLAGMEKMKEQMMKNAIDGYVIEDIEEGNGDFLLSAEYISKSMGLKDRQKVKVIVIRED